MKNIHWLLLALIVAAYFAGVYYPSVGQSAVSKVTALVP